MRRYTLSEIKEKVDKAGFKVIRHFKYEGILRNILFTNKFLGQMIKLTKVNYLNCFFTKLDNLSLKLFGESQIVLICKNK